MEHKVIITSQGKVVVDETAEIKTDDWYVDDTNQIRQSITFDKHYWSQRVDYCKIIYTINFSIDKDIPMVIVEDEVEQLALIEFKKEDDGFLSYDAFVKGFKASQQKGVYSEEDLINLVAFICNKEDGNDITISESGEMPSLIVKQFIQSLNQEYIELEMDCDYLIQCHCTSNKNCLKPTIKTNRIDGQLISYTKK